MKTEEVKETTHESELEEARSVFARIMRLHEDSDFRFLATMQQANLDEKVRTHFSSPSGLDDVIANIYNSGRIAGFQEAMFFSYGLINGAQATIAQLDHVKGE